MPRTADPSAQIFAGSDNALGSPSGDVDDAFALAALFRGGAPLAAVASVFGNTTEPLAFENTRALAETCGWRGTMLHGATRPGEVSEAARVLAAQTESIRVLALGPLTDVAAAMRLAPAVPIVEVIVVGANFSTRGRWPPWWPMEFNLTHDLAAAQEVFAHRAPLTILPLDVARRLKVGKDDLAKVPGAIGSRLRDGSARWFRRTRLHKWSSRFAVWDLGAALYALDPASFQVEERGATLHANGWVEFGGKGARAVRVIAGFEPGELWERFLERMK